MIKICELCKKEYKTDNWRRKYCSKACYSIVQKTICLKRIKRICGFCKKEFGVVKADVKKVNYCSNECWYSFQRAKKIKRLSSIKPSKKPSWNKGEKYSIERRQKMRDAKIKQFPKSYVNPKGYRVISWFGRHIKEHQFVWREHHNYMPIPRSYVVHHINLDKLDNRIDNLVLLPNGFHSYLHRELNKKGVFS